jgi:predicted dienelactone hydrolase
MRRMLMAALMVFAGQLPAGADERIVGFMIVAVPNGAAAPIETGPWYPAEGATPRPTRLDPVVQDVAPGAKVRGRDLPFIIISHGSGSSLTGHVDTAFALAQAGFVVAAPSHTGDNTRDSSGSRDIGARTRQFAAVIEHVAAQWNPGAVSPERIGAFGYSAGAFTVLAAAGGTPELGRIAAHCAAHPGFFDCRLLASTAPAPSPPVLTRSPYPLRAIAVAAPALGFTFGPGSLAQLSMPVQLWQAEEDAVLPAPYYTEPVRAALPRPPEFHAVAGAGHFDFMAPCPPGMARAVPAICGSAPGFDRSAFHARFNAELIRFMADALRP